MKKVLIVDDEKDLAELTSFYLEDQGFQTTVTSSASEAMTLLQNDPFDFVITDVRMPKVSGVQLVNFIQETIAVKPQIILVSGFDEVIDKKIEDLKVKAVLTKPYQYEVLLEFLK